MKWMNRLVALAAAAIIMSPGVASAYTWYGAPNRTAYAPASQPRTAMTATADSTASAVEQALLRLTNQERAKYSLAPLKADSPLTSLARLKSSDMVAQGYFGHTSPTYGSPAQMLARYRVSYRYYAENIAQGADATRIHAMWMASPGHRANILDGRMTHIGIGLTPSGSGYSATQLFVAR